MASGGAGCSAHLRDAFLVAHADAAIVAGILHENVVTIADLKHDLAQWGIPVRRIF